LAAISNSLAKDTSYPELIFFTKGITFCMTVNKAQGLTFKKIGMYLPQPVFSYGQLYVALS